jgi:hypothetical protein
MSKNLNTTFFKTVANHNLERFHSETISWLFNTFPDAAREFIMRIHPEIRGKKINFKEDFCSAEKNQIDILIEYTIDKREYKIFIENKMKASEHLISAEKLDKNSLKKSKFNLPSDAEIVDISKNPKLSQTEYYYLREKLNHPKELVEQLKKIKEEKDAKEYLLKYTLLSESEIVFTSQNKPQKLQEECHKYLIDNLNLSYCRFVYLKPTIVDKVTFEKLAKESKDPIDLINTFFDFKQNNQWNKEDLGDNPWKTITYKTLAEWINNSKSIPTTLDIADNVIANSYLKYINENIVDKVDLTNFGKNPLGQFEYFKLLFAIVKSKLVDEKILYSINKNGNESDLIYEYIEAGSSNGGMPLFAFYKKIKTDENFKCFKDKIKPKINIGIQIQGENFKYYVSADHYNYDKTKVEKINKNTYGDFVKKVLTKITEEFKADFNDLKNEGFNPNKNKTFYSRSYKILGFIKPNKDGTRNIFEIAEEISKRVNAFISFEIINV